MAYYKDLSSREYNEISNLLIFVNELIIKDEEKAEEHETKQSSVVAFEYLAAINKTDSLLDYAEGRNYVYASEEDKIAKLEELRQLRIESYIELNPYYKELNEKYGLNIAFMRMARDYDLLYYPKKYLSVEESKIFSELYFSCMRYYTTVTLNQAYESYSLYRNFSRFFIVLMTLDRYISAKMVNIHNYDLFDAWSLRNMFISYDLDYFYDLPVKYQRRLLKNLNIMIKNKGTNQVIVDIVNLFGFENVNIFKHFLAKDYQRTPDGEILTFDNPELKFFKADYRTKNIQKDLHKFPGENYDLFIEGDPYWQATKEEVLKENFNLINTKYFSVDATMDLVKTFLDTSYIINMINYVDEYHPNSDLLQFTDSNLASTPISLLEAIVAMNILLLDHLGYEDNIIHNPSSIAKVYGFNFEKEFMYPLLINANNRLENPLRTTDITSGEFVRIFNHNNNLRLDIERQIYESSDYIKVKNLQKLKKVQFTCRFNREIYEGFETYGEYLHYHNPSLHNYVINAREKDSRKGILEIASSLEQYINHPALSSFLNVTPVMEYIEEFLRLLINIFKSYTTELKDFSVNYLISDKLNERIHILEKLDIQTEEKLSDLLLIKDTKQLASFIKKYDKLSDEFKDAVSVWNHLQLLEDFSNTIEDIGQVTSIEHFTELLSLGDTSKFESKMFGLNKVNLNSRDQLTSLLAERINLNIFKDYMYIGQIYMYDTEFMGIDDHFYNSANIKKFDKFGGSLRDIHNLIPKLHTLNGIGLNSIVIVGGEVEDKISDLFKLSDIIQLSSGLIKLDSNDIIKDKIVFQSPHIIVDRNNIMKDIITIDTDSTSKELELLSLGDTDCQSSCITKASTIKLGDGFIVRAM